MLKPNFEKNNKSLSEKTKWFSVCPFCKIKLSIQQAKIIAKKKDSFLVHAYCKKCKCSILTSLFSNQMGISSIGFVTDLTYEDIQKFKNAKNISLDNILEAYYDLNTAFIINALVKRIKDDIITA